RQYHVPNQLSTGERQRTALARALLNAPSVLLADEPTGNLDQENAEIVLGHLAKFAADGGAVLMVTHDPEAAKRAQRIETIRDGKLVSDEPTN
ncbi:MAG: ATP-binding cassette domain-containing protein, partial [Planctomycetaceae bacterium]|nr:ATP-binding cassette domain-containing protein [Planctomycetaceae bacterium]